MKTWASRSKVVSLVVLAALVSAVVIFATSKETTKFLHLGVRQKSGAAAPHASSSETNPQWNAAYANLPLKFEENQGQSAQEVRFVSRGAGYQLFLTSQEAVLALRHSELHDLSPRHRTKTLRALRQARLAGRTTALRMQFEGANPSAQVVGVDQLPGKVNYFVGNNPKNWHTDVPTYARVKYASIYPGVDLIYYGNQRRLEYDLVVAPGADPNAIALNLKGAQNLRVDANGDLVVKVDGGEVQLQKPVVYQNIQGQKKLVAASYAVSGAQRVTFTVANYDRREPLVLDPILNFSTYLGGGSDEQGLAIAVDSNNNAIVAGSTFSTDFPVTTNASNHTFPSNANGAAFVTQLKSDGTQELYSTYLAGSSDSGEFAFGVAVDPSGKIYVTGDTFSTDFPTTANALKGTLALNANGTGFLAKIDPTKSGAASLIYSTYLGGTNNDRGDAVAVDANGNAYVAGYTNSAPTSSPFTTSTNFPIQNAFQPTLNSASGNAFLMRIDTTQSAAASLIYSTYLGGSGANAGNPQSTGTGEEAFGVAVDSSNIAYLMGTTTSTDFPASTANGGPNNGFKLIAPASIVNGSAFVAKIDTTKTGSPSASLIYSTYLGGDNVAKGDFGAAVALGPNNVAYVAGSTSSLLFPTTTGAFQTTGNTNGVAFVTLVDTSLTGSTSLKYSTFLGGPLGNLGSAIKVDTAGNAYVTGATTSNASTASDPTNAFPLTPGAFQASLPTAGIGGAFISKINPASGGSTDLLYSTYFGGAGNGKADEGLGIAIDSASPPNVYVTGQVFSSAATFPVSSGAFQTALNGTSDAFIAKLTLIPTLVVSPTSLSFGSQLINMPSTAQIVTLSNNSASPITFTSAVAAPGVFAATTSCTTIPPAVAATPGTCTVSVIFTPTAAGAVAGTLTLTDGDSSSPQIVTLSGTGTTTPPDFTLSATPTTVTVAQGSSIPFTVSVNPVNSSSQVVALTVTGLPANSTAAIVSTPVTLTGDGTAKTATVTIQTTAPHSAMMVPSAFRRIPPSTYMLRIVPLFLAFIMFLFYRSAQNTHARWITAAAMFIFVAISGCSSSSPATGGTPKGTSTLTVTGTSGSTTHTTTVTLTVN